MTPERWARIKEVFTEVAEASEDERDRLLRAACRDDSGLEAQLRQLRKENEATVGILDHPICPPVAFLPNEDVVVQPSFTPGQVVCDRFRIVRFLARGGMGEVFEAQDSALGESVALKTIRSDIASDPRVVEQFKREVRRTRSIASPYICRVYDLFAHRLESGDDIVFLTMQLLEGESLAERLRRCEKMTPEEALPLIRQISEGLEAAHQAGIIHRDLKSGNVMLVPQRDGPVRAVITDFGLAQPMPLPGESKRAMVNSFEGGGTPAYMAPEQLEGNPITCATDIYALGLVAYEMVTGRQAFEGESPLAVALKRLDDPPVAPRTLAPSLDPKWETAILRCLERDPEKRFANAGDFVRFIDSPPEPAKERWWGRPLWSLRTWKLVLAALAVPVLVGITAFGGLLLQPVNTSIMVFPIDNMTNRSEYNYLCKGTTAELLRRLTLVEGVRVIPYYEPRSAGRRNLAKAQFSLDGLLQVFEGRVRLTAQLIDNRDGALVWSQNFEREMHNPLELQSDIAEGSIHALEARALFGTSRRLGGAGMLFARPLRGLFGLQTAVARPATNSGAAFDYYIRGRDLLDERTVAAAIDAIRAFESALAADPEFALAETALAEAQFVLMDFDYAPTTTLLGRAKEYAEKAVKLGPDLAEAHLALAAVRQTSWDWAGAEASYTEALRLNPRFSRAHRWYAGLILQFGRFDEALAHAREAMDLDPFDYPGHSAYGLYLFYARRYQEAIGVLQHTLAQKDLASVHNELGDSYAVLALSSSGGEATEYFRKALEEADVVEKMVRQILLQSPPPSHPASVRFADQMHARYYALSGNPRAAQPYIDRMESDVATGRISAVPLAAVYAVVGREQEAISLLEGAVERKDRQLLYLKVNPKFDSLRNIDGFGAILKRMGL